MQTQEFPAAPWSRAIKVVTSLGLLLIGGVTWGAIHAIPPTGFAHQFGTVVACIPPALILGCGLFVVRSFRIDEGNLAIRRLAWSTTFPLLGIHDAWHDPEALQCSLRIFGNGGLFGSVGLFQNEKLGRYRLFATDPAKSVVLRLHDRTLVITPDDPEAFLVCLKTLFPRLTLTALPLK